MVVEGPKLILMPELTWPFPFPRDDSTIIVIISIFSGTIG